MQEQKTAENSGIITPIDRIAESLSGIEDALTLISKYLPTLVILKNVELTTKCADDRVRSKVINAHLENMVRIENGEKPLNISVDMPLVHVDDDDDEEDEEEEA